jgi:hypothetical protein
VDLKQRLEFLDMLVWLNAQTALSCFALKWYMDQFFYRHDENEQKKIFKTNIANTFLYQSNLSHFERCLISVADQIHEELNREPKPDIKVLHRWDLKNHRDYLSHPGKGGQFDNPEMKKFVEEKRYYKEPKATLLWNARRSILDTLTSLGSDRPAKNPTYIGLFNGMAELAQGAIHYCLNDSVQRPSVQEVREALEKFFSDFNTHLEQEAYRSYTN